MSVCLFSEFNDNISIDKNVLSVLLNKNIYNYFNVKFV